MKKFILSSIIVGASFLNSCSKNDDNKSSNNDKIIGTWKIHSFNNSLVIDECEKKETIAFTSNHNSGSSAVYWV